MSKRRYLVLAMAAIAATLLVAGAPVSAQDEAQTNDTTQNETDLPEEAALGHSISMMVSVSAEDVDNAFDHHKADRALERANSSEEKAAVANQIARESAEEVSEARERVAELREEYKEGEISEAKYKAERAKINASVAGDVKLVNETVSEVEAEGNASAAVDWSVIEQIRNNASNMTGQQVSTLAKQITDTKNAMDNMGEMVNEHANDRAEDARNKSNEKRNNAEDRGNTTETNTSTHSESNTSTSDDGTEHSSEQDAEGDADADGDGDEEVEAEAEADSNATVENS